MAGEGEDGRAPDATADMTADRTADAAADVTGDRVAELHDRAVEAGEPGYVDPATGLFVLTAAYLRDRGTCCGNGCRHCPY